MGAPLVGVAPIFALSFFGFDLGKKLLQSNPNQELGIIGLMGAGGFSGILTTVIMAPGERIKCILQVKTSEQHFRTCAHVRKCLYASAGAHVRKLFCAGAV